MLAVISGRPGRFAPLVELYQRALSQAGHPSLPVGMHSLGLVAETDEQAQAAYWPHWKAALDLAAAERGFPAPTARRYEADITSGALFVGSPDTVAAKIAASIRALSLSRFDLKYDIGRLSRNHRATTIELFGREVIPRVRKLLASPQADDPSA
jgi:alkanesulfonate monooxygenase SsuD/methylene tetrahydromethanopterin reductase-like flavin-dependent oxidoreductase (luciferase family)